MDKSQGRKSYQGNFFRTFADIYEGRNFMLRGVHNEEKWQNVFWETAGITDVGGFFASSF